MALYRSVATIGGYTMVSRVLGFVRDILVAAVLGAGPVADAFFVAFKVPNLFRRLFAEGAFGLAFVPLFAGLVEEEGEDSARTFAEQAFAVLLWTLLAFVLAAEAAMPWLMLGFAPGFASDPVKFDLTVELARITFPYLLFVSLVSLQAGVLNSLGRFAAAAATPIILNVCLIAAVLGLGRALATPGHALAWGVAAAGAIQFVWLAWRCARAGMSLGIAWPRLTARVRTLLRRILPVALGAGIYQLNLLVDMMIASLLPTGSISYLFYADRVNQLPLGVIGVAVGTALLPLLSRQLKAGDAAAAAHSQNRALEISLLFTLPAAVALMVIADPVVVVLFQRGAFGPAEAAATARALAVFAVGLPAYVLVKALVPGFFAREDTLTPVRVSIVCLAANVVVALLLIGPLLHVGIAAATAATAWLNAGLLAWILRRRGFLALDDRLRRRLPRVAMASVVMGAALAAALPLLGPALTTGPTPARVGALTLLVAVGTAVFAIAAHLLGAARLGEVRRLLARADSA